MTTYVIKRIPDGAYVARPGRASSYTKSLQHARPFNSREAADRERCPENEIVVLAELEIYTEGT